MKRVLVCALDWGLGHASRCVPVIQELQRQGAKVVIASSGPAGSLLRKEFAAVRYAELPGYNPQYPQGGSMMGKMFGQLPKFARTVSREHQTVEDLVREHRIDAVISDNRYGCYSTQVKSVFITHQVNVRLPAGWSMMASALNGLLHTYIRRFTEVWVPDQQGSGLTGAFMSPEFPYMHVGWLSRFHSARAVEKKYEVMVIVSGPEPQRNLFESMMRTQLQDSPLTALMVCGRPGSDYRVTEGSVEIVSHLAALEMEQAILGSEMVIARSGYSTIMDLIALGKKASFVPTPQQPEQIYLAHLLGRRGIAFWADQKTFVLESAMMEAGAYSGLGTFRKQDGLLERQIKSFLL